MAEGPPSAGRGSSTVAPVPSSPGGFLSYARVDDEGDRGRISQLCELLSVEVRMQTGVDFPVWQDRKDIAWGQDWSATIDDSLGASIFLFPVVTPSFFASKACREELERFAEHERQRGRNDLILPIYYIDVPDLGTDSDDELKRLVASRDWSDADLRALRFDPITGPDVRRRLAAMAVRVREAIGREPVPVAAAPEEPEPVEPEFEVLSARPRVDDLPALVVDAAGGADHVTIQEAIDAAAAGTRILVRPGRYSERLQIADALEVVGDGDADAIVIEAEQAVVAFTGTLGRLANVTLVHNGRRGPAVGVGAGRFELEACVVRSKDAVAGIIVTGAELEARGCTIGPTHEAGVALLRARCRIEDSVIQNVQQTGVLALRGSEITLRRNRITRCGLGGVRVRDSRAVLEDNAIDENDGYGLAVVESAVVVRRNRISRNRRTAIEVRRGGSGEFEHNELAGNAGGAWRIDDGAGEIRRTGDEG